MARAPARATPFADDWPGDHACAVCGVWGAYGRRKVPGDWRAGYVWYCGDHRPAPVAPLSPPAAPIRPVPKQGRLF